MIDFKPGWYSVSIDGLSRNGLLDDVGDFSYLIDGTHTTEFDSPLVDARPLTLLDVNNAPMAGMDGASGVVAHLRSLKVETGHYRTVRWLADQIEEQAKPAPRPTLLALASLIRGADTPEQGERLLEMWLADDVANND